jgi:spermidine/putrescine transport system ATP-binding protein
VASRDGDDFTVKVHDALVHAAKVSSRDVEGNAWVGVRPEKVVLQRPGEGHREGVNRLGGGVVTDVSFVGVSTQYLVRMPWDQELMVFEQNTGERQSFRPGEQAELTWSPEHTFLLDASQDALAGAELDDDE